MTAHLAKVSRVCLSPPPGLSRRGDDCWLEETYFAAFLAGQSSLRRDKPGGGVRSRICIFTERKTIMTQNRMLQLPARADNEDDDKPRRRREKVEPGPAP